MNHSRSPARSACRTSHDLAHVRRNRGGSCPIHDLEEHLYGVGDQDLDLFGETMKQALADLWAKTFRNNDSRWYPLILHGWIEEVG